MLVEYRALLCYVAGILMATVSRTHKWLWHCMESVGGSAATARPPGLDLAGWLASEGEKNEATSKSVDTSKA